MMPRRRFAPAALAAGLLAATLAGCGGLPAAFRDRPLSLAEPAGSGAATRIAALGEDAPRCLVLLDAAGVAYAPLPPVARDACGYADGVRLRSGGAMPIGFRPAGLGVACPVAAALLLWQRDIVQPAALRHFGRSVVTIDHYGSFSCRRVNNRPDGDWSQHATADAVDIAGFRLAGGAAITVRGDWNGESDRAAFLREVRDGACRMFSNVLSPDSNAAHADHFHLDTARRGWSGAGCG